LRDDGEVAEPRIRTPSQVMSADRWRGHVERVADLRRGE
jgi:hypothetical protein